MALNQTLDIDEDEMGEAEMTTLHFAKHPPPDTAELILKELKKLNKETVNEKGDRTIVCSWLTDCRVLHKPE